jgi:hypothetical protein
MPVRFAEIVNWGDMRETVLYALVAGVGITAQLPQAALYGIIAVAGLATSATGIILGLIAISGT